MTKEKNDEVEIKQAHLWSKIKAQVLGGENPFISEDENGKTIVLCPRCEEWKPDREYISFGVMGKARQWCGVVRKCRNCSHIFCLIQ